MHFRKQEKGNKIMNTGKTREIEKKQKQKQRSQSGRRKQIKLKKEEK